MQAIDVILADASGFQSAVAERRAFKPVYVKFKLMFACNLKCEMCNHWRETREPPLTNDRIREVLAELAALGCRKVHFSGGEPLLRPRVPDLIAYASELGLKVTMTTNGTRIDKAMAKALVESGLRGVNVSLDSPDRKTHDHIRGEQGAWKKTLKAIDYLHRYAHKGKLNLRINTVVSRSNYTTLVSLPDLGHQLGADGINLIGVDDHCGPQIAPRRRDIEIFNERIAPRIAERALALGLMQGENEAYPFGRSSREIGQSRRGEYALGYYDRLPCFAPWMHSLIDYNGLVYICCMTREQIPPLGDLKKSSFSEIWNGNRYQITRRLMHPPSLAPCRRCDDFIEDNRKLLEIVSDPSATGSAVEAKQSSPKQ